jgi:WD40 repeat protein
MVRLWNVRDGKCRQTLRGHTDWIRLLAFSPDGKILASASFDHTVRLWNVRDGKCLSILKHPDKVCSVAFSSNSYLLASGGTDETIRFWNVETDECLQTLRPPRPYEGTNITGATGLTDAQKATLKALGAIEDSDRVRSD